jgi:signal peptidase I
MTIAVLLRWSWSLTRQVYHPPPAMTQSRRSTRSKRGALVAILAAGAVALRRARLSPVRVEGDSMEPTLPAGALVAVSPLRGELSYGAVVVVRRPDGSEHLKRIVGTPGDRVRLQAGETTLGPGRFAVAGDNRSLSTDSRHYGPVTREEVVAVARACYWPPRSWRLLHR